MSLASHVCLCACCIIAIAIARTSKGKPNFCGCPYTSRPLVMVDEQSTSDSTDTRNSSPVLAHVHRMCAEHLEYEPKPEPCAFTHCSMTSFSAFGIRNSGTSSRIASRVLWYLMNNISRSRNSTALAG